MTNDIKKVWAETLRLAELVRRNTEKLNSSGKLNLGIKMVDWKKIKAQGAK